MVNTAKTIFRVHAATSVNTFLYYLGRFPLIGKLIPESLYLDSSLKNVITAVIMVIKQFQSILFKALYLCGAVFVPALLLGNLNALDEDSFDFFSLFQNGENSLQLSYFILILFGMSCLLGSFHNSEIFSVTRAKLACIKYMKMPAKKYVQVSFLSHYILHFLYILPFLFLFMLLLGASIWQVFSMFFLLISFRCMGEALILFFFEKTNRVLFRVIPFVLIMYFLLGPASYISAVANLSTIFLSNILLSIPFVLVSMAAGIASFYYVFCKYPNYSKKLHHTLEEKWIASEQMKSEQSKNLFKSVQMKEEDLAESSDTGMLTKFQSKKGYEYLQQLFFYRHKRQLQKPVLIRLFIILGLFSVVAAFRIIFWNEKFFDTSIFQAESIPQFLPYFVFGMYFMSIAEKACRAMFYNCDASFLHYAYYRKPKVILQNFRIRLYIVSKYNLILALSVNIAVIGSMLLFGANIFTLDTLLFVLVIFVLSVFFSVHHLCMYYILQPYTTEKGVKNPFYIFINAFVYFACYACLQIRTGNLVFALVVLAATTIYAVAALALTYKLSPKRFRVK